jgi:HSP20 family protein
MREMMTMQGALDKFFEDWRSDWPEWRTGEHFLALDITVHDDMLTINAEIPEHEVEHEEHKALIRERRYGRYSRSIRLPQAVNADKVKADYEEGTLKLTLPKTEDSRVKVIPVKTGK